MITFKDLKLNRQLLDAIDEVGYTEPTPIQLKAIPAILGGQDVMGISQTGTGKTAAYILPLLRILNYPQGNDPRALIIVPTRELSIQVGKTIDDLAKNTGLRHAIVFGGSGTKDQIAAVSKGIDILVASPGRFLDLYLEGHIVSKKIKHLVVDEAERLMDKSFISQFHRILEIVPTKRQNLLFSATMSDLVKKIAGDFLDYPIEIHIKPEVRTADTVSQLVYKVPNLRSKLNLLQFLLEKSDDLKKVIVFCKTKASAADIGKFLSRMYGDDNVRVVHGNKTQQSRINAIGNFKTADIRILVATDVAARGLDVIDVSHVVNFDVPIIYEDYVHRIGRTGRAFKTGESITFVTDADEYHLLEIQKLIKQTIKVGEIPVGVKFVPTLYDEKQEILREIDRQRRKLDPEYKGAFHEKKSTNQAPIKKHNRGNPIKEKGPKSNKRINKSSPRKSR